MESAEAVGAIVVDELGRVLLVRRGRPPGVGDWTIPGGRVEPGETLREAVLREVMEETAIAVDVLEELETFVLARDGFRYVIHEHLCAPRPGDRAPRAGDDAADARWVTPEELSPLGVRAEATQVILRALARARAR